MSERGPASGTRKFFAGLLDVFTIFGFGGYAIASITGGLTETGFRLEGGPAFLLFALAAVYFVRLNSH
jgi:uncharacterized membrane protein YoaK (UPF0700 family)